jgi:hypothetical protein
MLQWVASPVHAWPRERSPMSLRFLPNPGEPSNLGCEVHTEHRYPLLKGWKQTLTPRKGEEWGQSLGKEAAGPALATRE